MTGALVLAIFLPSTISDNQGLLDPPAGKHGFLTVKGEGFAFEDGKPARFVGVTIAKDSIFVDKETIEKVADLLARLGVNLVRFHHLDDTNGVVRYGSGGRLELVPERIEALDYWIACLKERGIYVYLDLLSYRTFKGAEKLGRGGKPAAVYDEDLIRSQIEYARLLLTHENPFTGRRYVDEPAIAMVEIYSENGLFLKWNWGAIPEPWRGKLKRLWNEWLRERYGSTEALKRAWRDFTGRSALLPGESLERGTVRLPRMVPERYSPGRGRGLSHIARRNDGAVFAYEIHRQFLRRMKGELLKLGLKVPVSAAGSFLFLPDLLSVARELDFVTVNYYYDHPAFLPGNEWSLPAFFHMDDPLSRWDEGLFAPSVALASIDNKPLVVRECSYCWPNPHRPQGMLELLAYGPMQGVDALILFTLSLTDRKRIDYFDLRTDPSRLFLLPCLARVFLGGLLPQPNFRFWITYSDVDAFFWSPWLSELYRLALFAPTSTITDLGAIEGRGVAISSGRSSRPLLPDRHFVLFSNNRAIDLHATELDHLPERRLGYDTPEGPTVDLPFLFDGRLFGPGRKVRLRAWPAFPASWAKERGLIPIGYNEAKGLAYGVYDPKRPAYIFHSIKRLHALRAALDAAEEWFGLGEGHRALEGGILCDLSGRVKRDLSRGRITVQGRDFVAFGGRLGEGRISAGPVAILTDAPSACFVAFKERKGWRFVFVRPYANRGERIRPEARGLFALLSAGEGPPRPVPDVICTLQVALEGQPLITLQTPSGIIEVAVEPEAKGMVVNFDRPPLGLRVEGKGLLVAEKLDGKGKARGSRGEVKLEAPGVWRVKEGSIQQVLPSG